MSNIKILIWISVFLVNAISLIFTKPVFAKTITSFTSTSDKIYIIAESRRQAFTITYLYGGRRTIDVKSVATGKTYTIEYGSPIEAEVGDSVTIIFNDDRWTTIINERTGLSAGITKVD